MRIEPLSAGEGPVQRYVRPLWRASHRGLESINDRGIAFHRKLGFETARQQTVDPVGAVQEDRQ